MLRRAASALCRRGTPLLGGQLDVYAARAFRCVRPPEPPAASRRLASQQCCAIPRPRPPPVPGWPGSCGALPVSGRHSVLTHATPCAVPRHQRQGRRGHRH